MAGMGRNQIAGAMLTFLSDKVEVSGAVRGTREKMVTILLRTWVTVPQKLVPFRNDALKLLETAPAQGHLAVHWAMTMAAYPFWGSVADVVGRLLRLQEQFTAAQAQRRFREKLGERETVARAARRVLRCFVDWHVVRDGRRKGTYVSTPQVPVTDPRLVSLLVEAQLRASGDTQQDFGVLSGSPSLFPFKLPAVLNLVPMGRLEVRPQIGGAVVVKLGE
jgi:hypothetical protein